MSHYQLPQSKLVPTKRLNGYQHLDHAWRVHLLPHLVSPCNIRQYSCIPEAWTTNIVEKEFPLFAQANILGYGDQFELQNSCQANTDVIAEQQGLVQAVLFYK